MFVFYKMVKHFLYLCVFLPPYLLLSFLHLAAYKQARK